MTAPTIAPVSAGAMWAFARTPEPAVCRSNHPHAQAPLGHVACAADHEALGTDVHGADVGGHWFTWTTAQATTAWASVRRCLNTYCGAPVPEGVTYCRNACRLADKHCASDHDDEAEAAA